MLLAGLAIAVVVMVFTNRVMAVRPITHCGDIRRDKAVADVSAIAQSIELFRRDHGRVPTREEGLDVLLAMSESSPLYLLRLPLDPWGNSYAFERDGESYSVISLGRDGRAGGSGRDADIRVDSTWAGQTINPSQPTASGPPPESS